MNQDPRTGAATVALSGGVSVDVYPVGLRQMREFDSILAKLAAVVARHVEIKEGRTSAEYAKDAKAAILAVAPALAVEAITLAVACTRAPDGVDLAELPHWDLAKIGEAWLTVNFDSPEKLEPWMAVARSAANLAGQGATSKTSSPS